MEEFRFKKWKVYDDSQALFSEILSIAQKLPSEHRFTLGTQILRSSSSIILNIAEGSGKSSEGDFVRFLNIALGSAYETSANLDILARNGLLQLECQGSLDSKIAGICRQLGGLKRASRKK